jgi:serine/threonine-protein kinase HipA
MIFNLGQNECFVYITLPGQTVPVIAGKFTVTVDRSGITAGRFRYGKSYLARQDRVAIDPVELTLSDRTYRTTIMKGVFGVLRDAGPDYWGRRVIERHAGVAELSEIDYLLYGPDDRAGALGFGPGPEPVFPKHSYNQTIALKKLQTIADAIINEEEIQNDVAAARIDEFMLIGTSMGGARPKAVVEDEDGLWLAKFNRPDDRWNCARVEHAMLALARECGVNAAKTKIAAVAGRDVLLVKRFDRLRTDAGYQRSRMVSGLTLLRAEDTLRDREKWSYPLLVEEVRRVSSSPKDDARELFSRMCFNAMISNTDDHPRNHAMIAWEDKWVLSPAYDLMPSTPVSSEHRDLALICGDAGRFANAGNLLSQCARFFLTKEEARARLAEMQECIESRWYGIARASGVSETDCEKVRGAFLYEGYFYNIDQ